MKKRMMYFAGIVILAAALIVIITPGITAKYLWSTENTSAVKAKEFYFTSDYLTPEGLNYTLNPGTGNTVDFVFELRNYEGLNVSEMDIKYDVDVRPNAEITYSGDKKIEAAEGKETVTLTLERGKSYDVKVTGKNGYRQTLKATFEVADEEMGVYKNTQNYGDYVLLTVWENGVEGDASVKIPAGLIPDATDSVLNGKKAGDTFVAELGMYESRTYRFFTTADYKDSNIQVSYGSDYLEETPLN